QSRGPRANDCNACRLLHFLLPGGSNPIRLTLSISLPIFPQQRTLRGHCGTAASCQKPALRRGPPVDIWSPGPSSETLHTTGLSSPCASCGKKAKPSCRKGPGRGSSCVD